MKQQGLKLFKRQRKKTEPIGYRGLCARLFFLLLCSTGSRVSALAPVPYVGFNSHQYETPLGKTSTFGALLGLTEDKALSEKLALAFDLKLWLGSRQERLAEISGQDLSQDNWYFEPTELYLSYHLLGSNPIYKKNAMSAADAARNPFAYDEAQPSKKTPGPFSSSNQKAGPNLIPQTLLTQVGFFSHSEILIGQEVSAPGIKVFGEWLRENEERFGLSTSWQQLSGGRTYQFGAAQRENQTQEEQGSLGGINSLPFNSHTLGFWRSELRYQPSWQRSVWLAYSFFNLSSEASSSLSYEAMLLGASGYGNAKNARLAFDYSLLEAGLAFPIFGPLNLQLVFVENLSAFTSDNKAYQAGFFYTHKDLELKLNLFHMERNSSLPLYLSEGYRVNAEGFVLGGEYQFGASMALYAELTENRVLETGSSKRSDLMTMQFLEPFLPGTKTLRGFAIGITVRNL